MAATVATRIGKAGRRLADSNSWTLRSTGRRAAFLESSTRRSTSPPRGLWRPFRLAPPHSGKKNGRNQFHSANRVINLSQVSSVWLLLIARLGGRFIAATRSVSRVPRRSFASS